MKNFCIKGVGVLIVFICHMGFASSELNVSEDMNETLKGINSIINPSQTVSENSAMKRESIKHVDRDNQSKVQREIVSIEIPAANIVEGKGQNKEKNLIDIKNKGEQSSLVGDYTILNTQKFSDGKYTIKLNVNVSDKKGRAALGTPVTFKVNNGAVPALFNTPTDIAGNALFEFINYNRGDTLVSVQFDNQEIHIPIHLK
ncbi:MAG: Ig-like domain-containing protein [Providencia heimbachae]|nr:Ig-like domain-containing protein [Providencia heimbachae]